MSDTDRTAPLQVGDSVVHPDGRRGVLENVNERGVATVATEVPARTERILLRVEWLEAAPAAASADPRGGIEVDPDPADISHHDDVERALKLQAGTVLAREVERLRGDVREWERQLRGLGVAAGRGEPLDVAAGGQSRELLDQATCPHTDSSWDEDEWSCWDCGAYCNHAHAGDRDFECASSHARLKARPL